MHTLPASRVQDNLGRVKKNNRERAFKKFNLIGNIMYWFSFNPDQKKNALQKWEEEQHYKKQVRNELDEREE